MGAYKSVGSERAFTAGGSLQDREHTVAPSIVLSKGGYGENTWRRSDGPEGGREGEGLTLVI